MGRGCGDDRQAYPIMLAQFLMLQVGIPVSGRRMTGLVLARGSNGRRPEARYARRSLAESYRLPC
jgi:hypothetical protein